METNKTIAPQKLNSEYSEKRLEEISDAKIEKLTDEIEKLKKEVEDIKGSIDRLKEGIRLSTFGF